MEKSSKKSLATWHKIFILVTVSVFGEILYMNLRHSTPLRRILALSSKSGPVLNHENETWISREQGESKASDVIGLQEREEFQDEMFAPLLSAYKNKSQGNLNRGIEKFRNGTIPRVLLWSRPFIGIFWKSQLTHIKTGLCPLPCEVFFDEKEKESADAIIIYLRGAVSQEAIMKKLSPRDPTQPWIMLTFEAPPLANSFHHTKYRNFNGFFNRTMMYRRDADIRVPHGFIVNVEDAKYLPDSWVLPPVKENTNTTRKLAVAFISNCGASSNRLMYIRSVQEHVPIDIYGSCGTLKCGRSMYVDHQYNSTTDQCLKLAGNNYLFYFAFENSFCEDYLTEKAYNLLYYPIVPIFLGSADYATLFPPNSYIDARQYSPKELAERLIYLQNHPQEYKKLLYWRQYYQPSTWGGERTLCHLCTRLYDPDFYQSQVIQDFEDWFVFKSRCSTLLKMGVP